MRTPKRGMVNINKTNRPSLITHYAENSRNVIGVDYEARGVWCCVTVQINAPREMNFECKEEQKRVN